MAVSERGPTFVPGDGPGWRLREAREERNLSTIEIADALHLDRRIVEALEADDYGSLPPVTFTKGYLRAYARYVALPEDQILREFGSIGVREDRRPLTAAVGSESRRRGGGAALGAWVAAVVVVLAVLAGGGWLYWVRDGHPLPLLDWVWSRGSAPAGQSEPLSTPSRDTTPGAETPSSAATGSPGAEKGGSTPAASGPEDTGTAPVAGDESGAAAPVPDSAAVSATEGAKPAAGGSQTPPAGEEPTAQSQSAPATEPGSAQAASGADGTAQEPAGGTVQGSVQRSAGEVLPTPQLYEGMHNDAGAPADEVASGRTPEQPSSEQPSAPARESTTAASGGGVPLSFDFSGESWMEVRDANGERLMFGLITDDGSQTVRGKPPFDLVIGDVTHVSLEYDGKPVDLSRYAHDRVARFTLDKQ